MSTVFALLAIITAVEIGPHGCVKISRSVAGSCVISTNCKVSDDLSGTEFAFLCTLKDGVKQKHSYGFGGFDPMEEYDTQVMCETCAPPPPVREAAAPVRETSVTQVRRAPGAPPAEAAFYGPAGCIAAYRSAAGTCVLQTRCVNQDLAHFTVGLTCVDADGASVRHLFGQSSFDSEETFDTLIECQMCLGVNETTVQKPGPESPAPEAVVKDVAELKEEIGDLKKSITWIKDKLKSGTTSSSLVGNDREEASADVEEAGGKGGKGSWMRPRYGRYAMHAVPESTGGGKRTAKVEKAARTSRHFLKKDPVPDPAPDMDSEDQDDDLDLENLE